MEQVVHENERRLKQKEIDIDRLRNKLSSISSEKKRTCSSKMQSSGEIPTGNDYDGNWQLRITSCVDKQPVKSIKSTSVSAKQVPKYDISSERVYLNLSSGTPDLFTSDEIEATTEETDAKCQLEHLSHKVKVLETESLQRDQYISQLRSINTDYRFEVERLRCELDTRPNAKQWAHAQQEIKDLEEKIHDATLLRKETVDLQFWKKSLSTRDKIKSDKRNFELGLWLLDSLPKTVLKEALQLVCRELNISEISDIKPCLDKMKIVIHKVPRMEHFIQEVCDFLFKRSKRFNSESPQKPPILEEVLPLLNR
jgi:hypothetical protein